MLFRSHSIFFLDQFGEPNTGFLGGNIHEKILKTTDGGQTWRSVLSETPPDYLPISDVNDFTFKDRNTGWCSAKGGTVPGCYKTTDAGESWIPMVGSETGANGIYFDRGSDGLFASRLRARVTSRIPYTSRSSPSRR